MSESRPLERPTTITTPSTKPPRAASAELDACDLITFADGIEEAGFVELARRSRVVARDVLRLAADLDAERSARVAIQEQRDRLLEIVADPPENSAAA